MLNTPDGKLYPLDGQDVGNPHTFSPFNLLLRPHMKSPAGMAQTNPATSLQPFGGLAHNLYESAFK